MPYGSQYSQKDGQIKQIIIICYTGAQGNVVISRKECHSLSWDVLKKLKKASRILKGLLNGIRNEQEQKCAS